MTEHKQETASIRDRQRAMAAFGAASEAELEAAIDRHIGGVATRDLRPAETGLVMVRGRAGGTGDPFNLGEVTVTRAAVALEGGQVGHGYRLGRNRRAARLAAVADALWQDESLRPQIEADLVIPVEIRIAAERRREAGRVAATRVDFFTMVRGESE